MANEKRMGPKFTSGPWKFAGTFAASGNEFVDTAAVECGGGMIVANLNYDKGNVTEKAKAIADARLIAQAPAMYALLSKLAAHIDDELDITENGGPNWAMRLVNEFGDDFGAIHAAVEGK